MPLSDIEELVFFKVCQSIWSNGKAVHEDDVERLFRRPCEGIAAALQSLVRLGKFTRDTEGYIMNAKALKEHQVARGRVENARAAAASRWKGKRKHSNPTTMRRQSSRNAGAMPEQCGSNAIREDIELSKEKTPTESKRKNATGTRLSESWSPGPEHFDFALAQGFTSGQAAEIADRFRDHWIAQTGQRGTKRDWMATWRNWIRREHEDFKGSHGAGVREDNSAVGRVRRANAKRRAARLARGEPD